VANKNTSKNCESGFSQTKMKHLPTILAVLQQQNLRLAANSEEWNDDELDLYESIFSAKEQMTRGVWMLVRALKLY